MYIIAENVTHLNNYINIFQRPIDQRDRWFCDRNAMEFN